MTAPLRMSFEVDCSAEHAFAVWTSGIGTWWPADHTVTGQDGLRVVMQSGVGGRIYERTADGAEHDWGEAAARFRLLAENTGENTEEPRA